ncbi:MAG: hypothetical protein JRD93_00835 [Deltaproteobacteria bacterium]|nr:hypothetical protein [Deltaproteobacteria bacterium]MBW2660547.1 hypothetical protein [Deltaproteobacteria bacterium]
MGLFGGYILHLGWGCTGMDSLSEIILGNVKVPSEHADHIVPFSAKITKRLCTPQACVYDMGKGICKAVSGVFPGRSGFSREFKNCTGAVRFSTVCAKLCALLCQTGKKG